MKRPSLPTKQAQLRSLIRMRKQIVENISKLHKRKHFFHKNTSMSHDQNPEVPEGEPRKLIKKQTPPIRPDAQPKEPKKHVEHPQVDNAEEKDTEASRKARSQLLQRNKRVFGGLVSHLRQARSNIEAEKPKIEQKNKIIEQIQRKQKEKTQQLAQSELAKLENDLKAAEIQKESNSRQILRIQNQILLDSYTRYSSHLHSFLFTTAKPSLAWKPAKQFQAAKSLLGDKQTQLGKMTKQVELAISKYEEKFDYCTYMAENQREYYKNKLTNYYGGIKGHFLTETEPFVLWKPAKPMEKLSGLMVTSEERLNNIGAKQGNKSEEFFKRQMERAGKSRLQAKEQNKEEEEESNSPIPSAKSQSS